MPPLDKYQLERLAARFKSFAVEQFQSYTPLYEMLALGIAEDHELLNVLFSDIDDQPVMPLLFLGSVHFLLLKGVEHPLAAYYPSFTDNPDHPENAYPVFRAFCLEYRAEIRKMLRIRRVQTNEVQRCACLLPVFELISRRSGGVPLALVEIGTSAGLHLFWDRYTYDYGDGQVYGDPTSPVRIKCELRGPLFPPLSAPTPDVAQRIGLDLNPLDVRNPEDALWLQALLWAGHSDRAALLREAIALVRKEPPMLVKGNALETLPGVLAAVPQEAVLCVFHSYTLVQFTPDQRDLLSSMIAEAAKERRLYRLAMEWLGGETARIDLTTLHEEISEEHLANCHPHGKWLEWLRSG